MYIIYNSNLKSNIDSRESEIAHWLSAHSFHDLDRQLSTQKNGLYTRLIL